MLKLKRILPKEKIDPIDLQARAALLEARLILKASESPEEDRQELVRIRDFLELPT